MTIGADGCIDIVRRAVEADVCHLVCLYSEFYVYTDDLTDLLYNYVLARRDCFDQTYNRAYIFLER